jgi:hypothetical protein
LPVGARAGRKEAGFGGYERLCNTRGYLNGASFMNEIATKRCAAARASYCLRWSDVGGRFDCHEVLLLLRGETALTASAT